MALADPDMSIDLAADLWFSITSTVVVAMVVHDRRRTDGRPALGPYDISKGGEVDDADEEIPDRCGAGCARPGSVGTGLASGAASV